MRRLALVAALVAAAAAPAAARASTVAVEPIPFFSSGQQVSYQGDPGEPNDVHFTSFTGGIEIEDSGATIIPGDGCASVDANHVTCDPAGVMILRVNLLDGDDRVVIDDAAYPPPYPDGFTHATDIDTGDGADTVITGLGRDNIGVGNGDDYLDSGAGNDFVFSAFAEGPDDSAFPDDGNDEFHTGAGDDDLGGGPGDDLLDSGEGQDFVTGGSGDDTVDAGPGDDGFVLGDSGDDVLEGGTGNDSVNGGPGNDRVSGGEGDDRLETFDAEFLIPGPDGNAMSVYGPGSDTIEGGAGDDTMSAGLDDDVVRDDYDGGPGNDLVTYASRRGAITVSVDALANDGSPGENDFVGAGVESVRGGRDADSLTGGAGDETLDGGPGDDLLAGGGGADTLEGGVNDGGSDGLVGGAGTDTLRGGAGDDSLDGGSENDSLLGGGGSDSLDGGAGQDALAGGPGLDSVAGGDGDDVLRGGDTVLVGADGADTLDGGAGSDQLLGGPGNDTLDGGPDADRLNGEDGRDTISYETRNADVTVTFDDRADDGQAGEGDNVATDVESVLGGAVADTLSGDARANVLDGGSGEDYVDGAPGPDSLAGGSARDAIRARDGTADVVACGEDVDYAIVDREDTARDCEFVSPTGSRKPDLGRDAALRPDGVIEMRLPGTRRTIPLRDNVHVPLGTTLDSTKGRVAVVSARNAANARQTMTFYEGRFTLRQRTSRRPVTRVTLRGGSFVSCPSGASGRATAAQRRRRVRRLWGRGSRRRGHYRVEGRWSTGTVRGTVFLTEDRCDGTLTRVVEGSVRVRDHARRRTVVVRAGHSYLARAPRR